MKSLDRRIATAGPLLFKLGKFWRWTLGGKQDKSEITKLDCKKKRRTKNLRILPSLPYGHSFI